MTSVGAALHRPLRPIERWQKATDEVDFGERDLLLARARELGRGHRDAAEILGAHAEEQGRIAAELARWRCETRVAASTASPTVGRSPQALMEAPSK